MSSPGSRIAGLDGLRAIAVGAVIAFHFGVPGLGGGMLGVDIFFALSGFLITTLLLAERAGTGRVSLGRFWQRRARRLLPALFLTLAGVAAFSHWVELVPAAQLRGDLLAALYYGSNWHYVAAGENYFSRYGAPSPLLHLWSLAVEEQFYVVWPLVTVLVLRRRGRVGVLAVAGIGTVASAVWTFILYRHGASVSRLYFGTDTRAQALLAGAALAALLAGGVPARARSVVRWLGPAALVFLAWGLHTVTGSGGFLYQGGFLAVAAAACAVIASLSLDPGGPLARALSLRPARYVGRLSYGLYLYHWPLFLALDHARTGLTGPGLLGLRLVATGATAAASFHLIEEPIRSGRLGPGWGLWRAAGAMSAGALAATAGLLAVTAGPATASSVAPPARPTSAQLAASGSGLASGPGAHATQPVRAMLVGDSIGVTLA
ncbi:MAG: acyltransferase family protein, partial [Acidimicrobiales bacterium]